VKPVLGLFTLEKMLSKEEIFNPIFIHVILGPPGGSGIPGSLGGVEIFIFPGKNFFKTSRFYPKGIGVWGFPFGHPGPGKGYFPL